MYLTVRLFVLGLVLLLSGCGRLASMLDEVVPDRRQDYTKARTLPDLSIPPGLSSGAIRDKMSIPEEAGQDDRDYSDFQERQAARTKGKKGNQPSKKAKEDFTELSMPVAEVSVMDDQHVLVVEATRYELWRKLQDFWETEGYQLELDDADLGVLETTWLESSNKLRRNRFKVFAETGKDEGTTIVFLSHQVQELVTVDQPYGEDYEWGETVRDGRKEAALVERLKNKLDLSERTIAVSSDRSVEKISEKKPPYDPAKEFASRMRGRGKFGFSESVPAPNKANESERSIVQPELVESRDTEVNEIDRIEELRKDDGPKSIAKAPIARTAEDIESFSRFESSVEMVSVGRGKYYLTVESSFNAAWKSTKRALEVADISVRRADKGRGVFVVDLIEGGSVDSRSWARLKFWENKRSAQYQVSVTGIGNKTEIVVLDPDGRWITSHEAERLLDRIYNALVSGAV